MNYRIAQLLSPTDLGPSGTKVINIDVDKPISRILFRYTGNKLSAGMSLPSPANIPKIEMVDGSKVLHSLNGYENQALAYYSHPGIVMEHGQHMNNSSECDLYMLSFGRRLWDEQLAFLPKNFINPQLKITWDEDLSDTSATVNEAEVLAYIFDEKVITPMGFLMPVEHYSYTPSAADAYETIELPEDRPIRQMLVRAYYDGYEPWYNIDEARFDEGTLDRIPWDYTNLENYYRMMKSVWPLIVLQQTFQTSTGALTHYIPQTDYWAGGAFMGNGGATFPYHTNLSSRGGKLNLTVGVVSNITGVTMGYLPWHCYQFPMGEKDDIEDWYNPAGKKPRLRLRASTGAGNVLAQVVLEELYKY